MNSLDPITAIYFANTTLLANITALLIKNGALTLEQANKASFNALANPPVSAGAEQYEKAVQLFRTAMNGALAADRNLAPVHPLHPQPSEPGQPDRPAGD